MVLPTGVWPTTQASSLWKAAGGGFHGPELAAVLDIQLHVEPADMEFDRIDRYVKHVDHFLVGVPVPDTVKHLFFPFGEVVLPCDFFDQVGHGLIDRVGCRRPGRGLRCGRRFF